MEARASENTIALHNKAQEMNLRWLGSREEAKQPAEDCCGWTGIRTKWKREAETLKKDTELQKHRSLLITLEVNPNSSESSIRCLRGIRLLQH